MAATEPLAVVRLDPADAAGGLALSTEAGWNQNEADWRLFLAHGVTFGVRDGGRLIATAALLPHDAAEAWIGMVLVTAAWRRRGLATRLMAQCLGAARDARLTASLDATPDGAAVYGRIGFAPTLELRRLRLERPHGSLHSRSEAGPGAAAPGLEDFVARDRAALGCDRSRLLGALARRTGSRLVAAGSAAALVRDGRTGRHLGPLFAPDAGGALALVRGIAADGGALVLDAPAAHGEFVAALVRDGWTVERPFRRMRFGGPPPHPPEPPPFAIAGPEYG